MRIQSNIMIGNYGLYYNNVLFVNNIIKKENRMKKILSKSYVMGAGFALLNIIMYFSIKKFWIGGSSFLPFIGKLGDDNKFLFALIVNIGVIIGSFIGAISNGEFMIRIPMKKNIIKAIVGGIMVGIGITLAPGTCTTAIVVGLPMLSVSSLQSIAGIFIGAYIVYYFNNKTCKLRR